MKLKLGITGFPLAYTKSPALHAGFLKKARRQGEYLVLPFDPGFGQAAFERFLDRVFRHEGFRGLNVTVPFKEWAHDFARKQAGFVAGPLGKVARATGSVNTLLATRGGVKGASTDGAGFLADLGAWKAWKKALSASEDRADVLIVGTGGSARAILGAALGSGEHASLRLSVWGRNEKMVRQLTREIPPARKSRALAGQPLLIVWCLPQISQPDAKRIFSAAIGRRRGDIFLYDLNYADRAKPTRALVGKNFRRTGEGMLLEQARLSFELWISEETST